MHTIPSTTPVPNNQMDANITNNHPITNQLHFLNSATTTTASTPKSIT